MDPKPPAEQSPNGVTGDAAQINRTSTSNRVLVLGFGSSTLSSNLTSGIAVNSVPTSFLGHRGTYPQLTESDEEDDESSSDESAADSTDDNPPLDPSIPGATDFFLKIPAETQLQIASYLNSEDLRSLHGACRILWRLTEDRTFFRHWFRPVDRPFTEIRCCVSEVRFNPILKAINPLQNDMNEVYILVPTATRRMEMLVDSKYATQMATNPPVKTLRIKLPDIRMLSMTRKNGITVKDLVEVITGCMRKDCREGRTIRQLDPWCLGYGENSSNPDKVATTRQCMHLCHIRTFDGFSAMHRTVRKDTLVIQSEHLCYRDFQSWMDDPRY